jgi:hypothetical protein
MENKSTFGAYGTASNAEEGVKFPLLHPITHKETGDWIMLRGSDSETVQRAGAEADHAQVILAAETSGLEKAIKESKKSESEKESSLVELAWETKQKRDKIARTFLAHTVLDWTNKELGKNGKPGEKIPVTIENVIQFFINAPQLQEQIDSFTYERKNFIDQSFNNPSTN